MYYKLTFWISHRIFRYLVLCRAESHCLLGSTWKILNYKSLKSRLVHSSLYWNKCIPILLLQAMYNLYITHGWEVGTFLTSWKFKYIWIIHSNQYHLNADLHNHIMIRPINQLEQHNFFQFRLTLWCALVWLWCCCLFGRSYLLEKLKAFDLSSVSCDDDDDESS